MIGGTTMKQFRLIQLLVVAMFACGTVAQAQYLNVHGIQFGSIPLGQLDKLEFGQNEADGTNFLKFSTLQNDVKTLVPPTYVDSLTITDEAVFDMPAMLEKVWVRLTSDKGETNEFEMIPVWGLTGVFHAMCYLTATTTTFEYSGDREKWYQAKYIPNMDPMYVIGDGWVQLVLNTRTQNYIYTQGMPFTTWGNRTSRAKLGYAYIVGNTAGYWYDSDVAWKLTMPVNSNGWWASPRFKADGEVRAYVKINGIDWWCTEFTIHNGKIFWRDSDIPSSWAANMGTDYSVQGKAGQKLYVNFTTGEALVSTPDEVTFPLENPVFRTSTTVYTNDEDPTLCGLDPANANGNTVVLRWDAVDGASGYRIKMAYQNNVSAGGAEVWDNPDNILLDKTVDANTLELTIPNLDYSTTYRFAIQALSPRGEQYNSAWFGYGGGHYWYAYLGIVTNHRYHVPSVIYIDNGTITKNSVRVKLNLSIASNSELEDYRSHFNFTDEAKTQLRVDYITVKPYQTNPDAMVPTAYEHYLLTDADKQQGYVDITGLDPNTTYVITAWDATIEAAPDACYNSVTVRTKKEAGPPVTLNHAELMSQAPYLPVSGSYDMRSDVYALAEKYEAAPISPVLNDYMTSVSMGEGQVFYLEGGKTYYLDGYTELYKGLTLATLPSDVAAGKRARIICGIGQNANVFSQGYNGQQWNGGPYAMFMLGRQPETGESGELNVEKIAFVDIDFDNPEAFNYGEQSAGLGSSTGNYFFNMYSNGMGMVLDELVIENCTFKRFVRGFIREQGLNRKVWNHVLIKNNQFFDCGYYNQGAGGYGMIHGSGSNGMSNMYKDFKCIENTFYDSPFPTFIDETRTPSDDWQAGAWNITFSNNTLVNFNTRANGAVFKMRNLPDGSVYTVQNNLFVLCKKSGDQRVLQMYGADIRGVQILEGGASGHVTLNFSNNWSTNNDLTNGQIFSANAWTANSNSFGKLVKDNTATLNGSLEIEVADISATDLMEQPCPPHVAATAYDQNMHRADALDGTATSEYNVNLYFKNTANDIYTNNVGAARWRKVAMP